MIHVGKFFDQPSEALASDPLYPDIVMDDGGVAFLRIDDSREYEISKNPAAVLRPLHHVSEKSWVDRDFLELAILRICISMGWWYPDYSRREIQHEDDHAPFMISKSEIIKRGWTRSMIDEFLGDQDKTSFGYKYGNDILLYDYNRIVAVENSEEWQLSFMERLPIRVERSSKSLRELMSSWEKEAKKHARWLSNHTRRHAS